MREIATKHGHEDEWPDKYGTSVSTPIFVMHPFCWCERDDCPWCAGCECPPEAFRYFIDGVETPQGKYHKWFYGYAGPYPHEKYEYGTPEYKRYAEEWDAKILERNRRASEEHTPMCDFCKGTGIFGEHGADPGRGAPNFWYKPANFKVWWYKYIGRSMETNFLPALELLAEIRKNCL